MNILKNKLKHFSLKKRGTTQMHSVHARTERKQILLNSEKQLVEPTDEVVIELSSFLGTLERNATLCPFDIFDWRYMETKKDLWDYTKMKCDIPKDVEDWALERIRDTWRNNKTMLKKKFNDPYPNDEVRLKNKPDYISECQFKELLIYWRSDKFKNFQKESQRTVHLFIENV